MRVKLITFRYSATLGGFDDTALVDFTRDKEVIAFREHFYSVNEVPHLSCIVHYQDAVVPQAVLEESRLVPQRPIATERSAERNFRRRDGAPDPCEGLDDNERALFNHLREWRAKVAHDEGLPPFLVLTNRHLLAIVRKRPDSATALGHIDGIGPGKVERYGAAILRTLHGMPREVATVAANTVKASITAVASVPAEAAPASTGTPSTTEVLS